LFVCLLSFCSCLFVCLLVVLNFLLHLTCQAPTPSCLPPFCHSSSVTLRFIIIVKLASR
jgi:hypothetical protein